MKKTFTQSILFSFCLIAFVSCAKEVKNPVSKNVSSATTSKTGTTTTTTTTATTTQTQSGHTCGGGSYTGTGH